NAVGVVLSLGTALTTADVHLDVGNATVSGTGTLTNATGEQLEIQGGTISAPFLNAGILHTSGATTISGSFTTTASSILRLSGSGATGSILNVSNSFTNNGQIELTSETINLGATMNVTTGTLTNAAAGTITSLVGGGGGGLRTIGAQLDNQGTINIEMDLSLSKPSADHSNAGSINLNSGDFTISHSGTTPTFSNSGTIHFSPGRSLANTNGTFNHNVGSTFVGGSAAQFVCSGSASVL